MGGGSGRGFLRLRGGGTEGDGEEEGGGRARELAALGGGPAGAAVKRAEWGMVVAAHYDGYGKGCEDGGGGRMVGDW